MSEKPILFSAPMVRAILGGRKTQTRRIYNPDRKSLGSLIPGDRLWVREAWALDAYSFPATQYPDAEAEVMISYRAGGAKWFPSKKDIDTSKTGLRPSIFMPRWASRINLEITAPSRIERLQDISEEDAIAEGCECKAIRVNEDGDDVYDSAKEQYQLLWDSINGKRFLWSLNPLVRVITFKLASFPNACIQQETKALPKGSDGTRPDA